MTNPLLVVSDLKKYYPVKRGIIQKTVAHVRAVDGVSFDLMPGETLGLVGESGCGKTTAGKAVINLIRPSAGSVLLNTDRTCAGSDYVNIADLKKAERKRIRRDVQIIFQNPYNSLNPRMTVGRMLLEVVTAHRLAPSAAAGREMVASMMHRAGLAPSDADKYPHEFSGGQRQRVGIARALLVQPRLIVCDEPVSALDVSIQAQIINLLAELKRELGLAYLFIAHDLAVVRHISDRVAVMYLGRVMEIAPKRELYENPLHPYTEALLSAVPVPDPDARRKRILLTGEVPSPMALPTGCRFRTRCPLAQAVCAEIEPELTARGEGHRVACHFR